MKKILSFAGSNNPQSINHALVSYASLLLHQTNSALISLREYEMPVFSVEILRKEGVPESAYALRRLISLNDGFIISVSENNHSVAAVFKNIMDWISKADNDFNVFNGKPVLLMGTSPSPGGAKNAIAHAESIISVLGGIIVSKFSLPLFFKNVSIDETGFHINEFRLKNQLRQQVEFFESRITKAIIQAV